MTLPVRALGSPEAQFDHAKDPGFGATTTYYRDARVPAPGNSVIGRAIGDVAVFDHARLVRPPGHRGKNCAVNKVNA